MKRKLLQLAHALPDPLPLAGAVVLVLVVAGIARAALAQGLDGPDVRPIQIAKAGESVICANAAGCVAMTTEAYRAMLMEAISRGARTCRKDET